MKAIKTKYLGPTDTRGSRISASDEDGNRITIPYPHELNNDRGHLAAAEALCRKMKWSGELNGGSLKNGYVFTFDAGKQLIREAIDALGSPATTRVDTGDWLKEAKRYLGITE